MRSQVTTELMLYASLFLLILSAMLGGVIFLRNMQLSDLRAKTLIRLNHQLEDAVAAAYAFHQNTTVYLPENCTVTERVLECGQGTLPHNLSCRFIVATHPHNVTVIWDGRDVVCEVG